MKQECHWRNQVSCLRRATPVVFSSVTECPQTVVTCMHISSCRRTQITPIITNMQAFNFLELGKDFLVVADSQRGSRKSILRKDFPQIPGNPLKDSAEAFCCYPMENSCWGFGHPYQPHLHSFQKLFGLAKVQNCLVNLLITKCSFLLFSNG